MAHDKTKVNARAVIFDFGGVVAFHPDDEQIAHVARECRLSVPEFLKTFWDHRIEYDAGRVHPREYWQAVAPHLEMADAQLERLIQLDVDLWSRYDPRVLDWVRQLQTQGIATGLLSNLPQPLGDELRASGVAKQFDHVTFSHELRIVKPERGIYEYSIAGLGIRPENALFLDDRAPNIEGAAAAGLRAELYATWEEFLASGAIERHGLPRPK